jgi:hypothetical protein
VNSLRIFNQDSAGNNTITSTYYQNIIHYYFLKNVNSYFTLRDIVNDIIPLLPLRIRKEKKDHNITEQKSYIVEDREKTFRKYFLIWFHGEFYQINKSL